MGTGSVNVLVNKCIAVLVDQDIIDPNLLSWPGDYKEGKGSTKPSGHLTYVHIDSIIKVVTSDSLRACMILRLNRSCTFDVLSEVVNSCLKVHTVHSCNSIFPLYYLTYLLFN